MAAVHLALVGLTLGSAGALYILVQATRLEVEAPFFSDTDMLVGEVAAASGFDNCCSFARAFRARYGLSASGYRTAASSTGSAKSPGVAGKAVLRTGT